MSWEKTVLSSMVSAVAYSEEDGGMIVTWNNGKRSLYSGVDEGTAIECAQAASVGQYINTEIKPNYGHRYV